MRQIARAKINLALHVTGQREDGYHLLDTLVTFAEVGDGLEFQSADHLSLTIDGPEGPGLSSGSDNLVLKAAELLRDHAGDVGLGAHIVLNKCLPIASGIGGGSADAAATLLGLRQLWNLTIDDATLSEISLKLGADMPMCLNGRPALVQGIGEQITPVPLPVFSIVLVNPRVEVATPNVFLALQSRSNTPLSTPEGVHDWISYLTTQRNDLEAPAQALCPAIGSCLNALRRADGCRLARMSGSGATCFGLFDTDADAERAASDIQSHHSDWWVVATRTIG